MKMKFMNATLGEDYSTLDIVIACRATYIKERTDHEATITDLTFRREDHEAQYGYFVDGAGARLPPPPKSTRFLH